MFSKLKIRKSSLASLYSHEADGAAMRDLRMVVKGKIFASKRESAYTDPEQKLLKETIGFCNLNKQKARHKG